MSILLRGFSKSHILFCSVLMLVGLTFLPLSAQSQDDPVQSLQIQPNSARPGPAGTVPTAEARAGLSAFALVSRVYTDYGTEHFGYTLGGDYTLHRRYIAPSLEVRSTLTNGSGVTEDNFLTGIKAETRIFRRVHPYGDFLIGYGTIQHIGPPNGYNHDNSIVYDVGVGVDYTVSRRLSVRGDAQYQRWRVGDEANPLEPYNVSMGVVYRVPFGFKRPRK